MIPALAAVDETLESYQSIYTAGCYKVLYDPILSIPTCAYDTTDACAYATRTRVCTVCIDSVLTRVRMQLGRGYAVCTDSVLTRVRMQLRL
eukprot:2628181-Rhodomonas_salina.1